MPNLAQRIIARLLGKPTEYLTVEALGREGQGLLSYQAYMDARETIVMRIFSEWVATGPDQVSKREQLHQQICALGKVQAELNLLVLNQTKDNGNAQS